MRANELIVITAILAVWTGLSLAGDYSSEEVTPYVAVNDQPIVNDTVMVIEVVSDGPGWMVIHADEEGAPGPVLGYSAVNNTETDVLVAVDTGNVTSVLYAMLHVDEGTVGVYEFPDGPDVPVIVDEEVVFVAFNVTE